MDKVSSASEWARLPQVDVPELKDQTHTGAVERVLKVGFLGVSEADCRKAKIKTRPILGLRCVLPTAVFDRSGETQLARLPVDLGPWVLECIALARAGKNQFPTQVEFGTLEGRAYAEFVVPPRSLN